MKQIDFTKTGGFPLTQDVLAYMQSGYSDVLGALCAARGVGPYILSGCVFTSSLGNTAMSVGYIAYNGVIYRVAGGSVSGAFLSPATDGLTLVSASVSLTYNDGSVNTTAQQEQYFVYGGIPNSNLTSTQIPRSLLQPFAIDTLAGNLSVSAAGSTTGTITYRKNWLANTVQLCGTLTVGNPQGFSTTGAGTGPAYYVLQTLPVNYRPSSNVPFSIYYRYYLAPILDDSGVDHIIMMNGEVEPDGTIAAGMIKAAAGVTAYQIYFNCIIPLS